MFGSGVNSTSQLLTISLYTKNIQAQEQSAIDELYNIASNIRQIMD